MRVPEAVIFDMDNRCFELRKAGLSYNNIAKALDCSTGRAWNGVKRTMERISIRLAEDNRDTHRLELERLDSMLQHLWPLTMPRKVRKEDGSGDIDVPPSMDAVDRVLKIMDRRAKLLGLDTQVIHLNTGRPGEVAVGPAAKELGEITPKEEAMRLMRLFVDTGVMDPAAMAAIKLSTGLDIVDAEVVSDSTVVTQNDPDDDGEPFFGGMPDDPEDPPLEGVG
jgi:hypothetical protein